MGFGLIQSTNSQNYPQYSPVCFQSRILFSYNSTSVNMRSTVTFITSHPMLPLSSRFALSVCIGTDLLFRALITLRKICCDYNICCGDDGLDMSIYSHPGPVFSGHLLSTLHHIYQQQTDLDSVAVGHRAIDHRIFRRTPRELLMELGTNCLFHAYSKAPSSEVEYSADLPSLQMSHINKCELDSQSMPRPEFVHKLRHWNDSLPFHVLTRLTRKHIREEMTSIALALSKGNDMSWAERQQKSRHMRRALQFITCTTHVSQFLSSTIYPPIIHAFRAAGAYGAVIHLDKADFHVYIVGTLHDVEHIRLPAKDVGIHLEEIIKHLSGQNRAAESGAQRRKMRMVPLQLDTDHSVDLNRVLLDIWEVLVKPILVALKIWGSCRDPGQRIKSRKRMIWCPTGLLTTLPLHAAGDYSGPIDSRDNVSNYVVSSYAPTLSAFCRATEMPSNQDSSPEKKNPVVVLAHKSSVSPLPEVVAEVNMIKDLVSQHRMGNFSDYPPGLSIKSGLKSVPNVEILHFAGHGSQDQSDPLNSGLELEDGRLTIDKLTQMSFPNGQLAYLSSCESASIDLACPDRGINLATTFLFNGFKSVIGTMWSMTDHDGPFIAERVYRRIFRNGKIDLAEVPWALDNAVRELRATGAPAIRWATYIHMGA